MVEFNVLIFVSLGCALYKRIESCLSFVLWVRQTRMETEVVWLGV
jgi:hypothetical protein